MTSQNSNDGKENILQSPYVKVATREIALLVQEIRNSQREKKALKERCESLEHYISVMGPSATEVNENTEQYVGRKEFFPSPLSNPAPFNGAHSWSLLKTSDLTTDSECDLETDSCPTSETSCQKVDQDIFESSLEDVNDRNTKFHVKDTPGINPSPNSSYEVNEPVILETNPELKDTSSQNLHIGVSRNYLDMALDELAKCKRSNTELLMMTSRPPLNREEVQRLENKVQAIEKEKHLLQKKMQDLEKNLMEGSQSSVISQLQKRIFRQEKQSLLHNVVLDELNKQCDKWRRKYEEISQQFSQVAKRINRPKQEEEKVVPVKVSQDNPKSATPNFRQLLKESDTVEEDATMEDISNPNDISTGHIKNDNDVEFPNLNDNPSLQDFISPTKEDIQEDCIATSSPTSNVRKYLQNLNKQRDVSTQVSLGVLGLNKLVQTDGNNNIVDEETQTGERVVVKNDNEVSENAILDLTVQNDELNRQYEIVKEENSKLRSSLAEMKESSVAKELADRMKQLNLQLFSVYREKDSMQRLTENDSSRASGFTDMGIYSLTSAFSESEPRQTVKLKPNQIALSDLKMDFPNMNKYKTDIFQREYHSCPYH